MTTNISNDNLIITSIFNIPVSKGCFIPYVQSLVSAGFPSTAENFIERSLDINDLLIKSNTTFSITVLGDSMKNAGILSGDLLIVDRSLSPLNNKIAVVRIDDSFTVKRIKILGEKILLVAENDDYKDIEISNETDCEIIGIVTFVIHKT
ncbi:MAG: S24 family peptidase [Candidatus Babeliales bacterium]|nr:S24 family peptidase [Candidatus Babeliales bacterium]